MSGDNVYVNIDTFLNPYREFDDDVLEEVPLKRKTRRKIQEEPTQEKPLEKGQGAQEKKKRFKGKKKVGEIL